MSGRPGASNQSWERKRFLSAISHRLLRQARKRHLEPEQAARQWLPRTCRFIQPFPGRGGVGDGAGKGELGHIGDGETYLAHQRAVRRIAPRRPAAEQAGPETAFRIHRGTIGIAGTVFDADENALAGKPALLAHIEAIDHFFQRVGVIEDASVGAEGGTIGDDIAFVQDRRTAGMKAIEHAAGLLLRIVHRAEPEPAFRIDGAVIQAVAQAVGFNRFQEAQIAAVRIEMEQAELGADQKSSIPEWGEEPRRGGRFPAFALAGAGIETMDAILLDVGEPERAVPPERALAQLGGKRPYAFRLARRRFQPQPASIQYSCPVHMRPSSEARNITSEATCLGSSRAFRHCCSTISFSPSRVYQRICRLVFTLPGTTQVTRILSEPSSRASALVMPSIPALAVSYRTMSGRPKCQEIEPKLTIAPPPRSFMPGATALAANSMCLRLTALTSSQAVT